MGLLDLFTGAASERAARNNASTIAVGQNQALGALGSAYGNAEGYLTGNALPALRGGFTQARGDLGQGYADSTDALTRLGALFDPMASAGKGAFDLYQDAIGANGADGQGRARAAFRTDPGYGFMQDQALGAVQRSAAARGGLAGGNATADILRTATGLADQSYSKFVDRLAGGASAYGQGIAGQAGALTGRANAAQGYGDALARLGEGLGQGEAGIYGNLAGLETARGQGVVGVIGQGTNALVQNNSNLAQSQNAAGANILGGILGLVNAGANVFGGVNGRNAFGGGR